MNITKELLLAIFTVLTVPVMRGPLMLQTTDEPPSPPHGQVNCYVEEISGEFLAITGPAHRTGGGEVFNLTHP